MFLTPEKKNWVDAYNSVIELLDEYEELDREGLQDTPKRILGAWTELLSGYTQDPAEILSTTFHTEGAGIQIVRNIEFSSVCEHHLLPFTGRCHIGYVPRDRVAGLSKLPRLVECLSRRLQIQERLSQQIGEAIDEYLDPIGVFVVCEAVHLCVSSRGVRKEQASFVTTCLIGTIDANIINGLVYSR